MNNRNQITSSTPLNLRGMKKGCQKSIVRNEKGIALAMMLILAAVALLIMAGLLYIITSSTQISGMQKRYKTALDAGFGGANISYQFISFRGDPIDTSSFQTLLSSINPVITTPDGSGTGDCSGTDISGVPYHGLAAKLMTPTYRNGVRIWSADCDSTMSIIPGTTISYDMQFEVPGSPSNYIVYAKIVDTVEGNSPADKGLGGEGVVVSGGGVVTVMKMPYLYTMEMQAQSVTNPSERAKLSILYQY
jgi:hypothetical protein